MKHPLCLLKEPRQPRIAASQQHSPLTALLQESATVRLFLRGGESLSGFGNHPTPSGGDQ